ncbi:MAG: protein 3 [Pseudomonadota bacterium]|jgi:(p)ppGpp synthase/HD superfamily hydrolase
MSKSPSLIDKGLAFCAGKFGGAQPSGDAGAYCVPDRTELIRILQEEGGESDPFLTLAAVLRQTLQLTSTSDEEIAQVFGSEVSMVVAELTENAKFSLATRKALRILVMPSLSRKAKLVVLAEIIETVRQISSKTAPKSWSLQHKQDYFVWAEKAVAAMGNVNPTLLAVFAAEIENSKLTVSSRTGSAKVAT